MIAASLADESESAQFLKGLEIRIAVLALCAAASSRPQSSGRNVFREVSLWERSEGWLRR